MGCNGDEDGLECCSGLRGESFDSRNCPNGWPAAACCISILQDVQASSSLHDGMDDEEELATLEGILEDARSFGEDVRAALEYAEDN